MTRVMIVDDDAHIRRALRRELASLQGTAVEDFADGHEALARVGVETFECALLDVEMPIMNGIELARRIIALDAGIAIVFVTGAPGMLGAPNASNVTVFEKPWRSGEVAAFVRELPARAPRDPIVIDAGRAPGSDGPRPPPGVLSLATMPKPSVLVIDDDATFAGAVARMLRPDFACAVVAGTGEALDLIARGGPFDVILCDLVLGNESGLAFYRRLRELRPGDEARIIFASASPQDAEAEAFLAGLPNLKLAKPFAGAELIAAVARVIATKESA